MRPDRMTGDPVSLSPLFFTLVTGPRSSLSLKLSQPPLARVCVYARARERDRERERDIQTETYRDINTGTETERDRDREREKEEVCAREKEIARAGARVCHNSEHSF